MRAWIAATLISVSQLALFTPLSASSLQVTPINVEVKAPGATTSLTLTNSSKDTISAQVRILRWTQKNGEEKLEPTTDVVVSPPIASVPANGEQIIRLVRTSKQPVAAEETYRILVDELPDPAKQKANGIAIAIRYSIPVFFMPAEAGDYAVKFSMERRDGKLYVAATNTGARRTRISELTVADAAGNKASLGSGLVGYVLSQSSMRWVVPGNGSKLGSGQVTINARGDLGPIHAQAQSSAAP